MLKIVSSISLLLYYVFTDANIWIMSDVVKIFVCGTLISVKSKYGSCSGSCTGFVKIKKKKNAFEI